MSVEEESILSDFTRFYLLVLLYEEATHGYALRQKFNERLGKNVSCINKNGRTFQINNRLYNCI